MTDQETITDLRQQVRELTDALDGAIWFHDRETRVLRRTFRLSPCQAAILLTLYKAYARRVVVTRDDLCGAIDRYKRGEFPSRNSISVHMAKVNKVFGFKLTESVYGVGQTLTERGYNILKPLLDA